LHKLELGVCWGRADVIEELLEQNGTPTLKCEALIFLFNFIESTMPAQEKAEALSAALQMSLQQNKYDFRG
jgi:hypothetical protein